MHNIQLVSLSLLEVCGPTDISAGLSFSWPGLMPSSLGRKSMTVSSWFQLSRHDPTLFATSLYSAISHERLYWHTKGNTGAIFKPREKYIRAKLELEAIKEVNNAIQSPSRAVSDAVLLSVASLANYSGYKLLPSNNAQLPFQSPLRSLQWLDIYGSLPSNHVHLTGLAQLVKLKGGLQRIKLPGLASALS